MQQTLDGGVFEAGLVEDLNGIGMGIITIPVKVSGGYWIKLSVSALQAAIEKKEAGWTDEQIVDLLFDTLGVVPSDVAPLVKDALFEYVKNMLKDLPGDCRALTAKSSSKFKDGMGEHVTCDFLICANTKWHLWGTEVLSWQITGGCNMTCKKRPHVRCCCGSKMSMFVTAKGKGQVFFGGGDCQLFDHTFSYPLLK